MDSTTSTTHKVDLEHMLLDESADPTHLPLSLLQDITDNFSDDQQIGVGGFAVVYKGILRKGTVAVKKLIQGPNVDESKFHKEVECMMKAKHKNIVRFLGYCSDAQGRVFDYEGKFVMADLRNWLLCFEYLPNGSLDNYINDASHGLEWKERYQIIKGICEGLLHLHEKRIIHLDLKPTNILVDDQILPKIADFGLSRCLDKEQTRYFTSHLCGSQGYLAPEFYRGQVSFASDIYSLGVIILEILTGEKGYPEDEKVVDNWMNRLAGSNQWGMQLEQVRVCTKIGIECMDIDPKKRPVARHIIDRLEKMASTIETGINKSSIDQQVSFLKEQYCQKKILDMSSEYLGKDIKECAETEELPQYGDTLREDHWHQGQQEAPRDQWSSWRTQGTKQNNSPQGARIASSNSSMLYKLRNLDIFNKKAQRSFERNGGHILAKSQHLELFYKGQLKHILKDNMLIGKGDFGVVYKGLVDNVPVVVKKLNNGTMLEKEQFANEIILQSGVIHKNIVRFIGCCLQVDAPMLVYEFLPNGSLHDILHGYRRRPLSLGNRLSIAAESTRGLDYLHSNASRKILHGEFKPANILLNDNFVPKIDFGMSRMCVADYRHTGIAGDMVYMDPVYLQTGQLTEQSDVYSFGVVMLELLTGKKATNYDNNSLVKNFLENHKMGIKSTELFDEEISVTRDLELLDNLAGVAAECLNLDLDRRPRMIDVARRLDTLKRSRLIISSYGTPSTSLLRRAEAVQSVTED